MPPGASSAQRRGHHSSARKATGGTRATDVSAEFHGAMSAQYLQRYAALFEALASLTTQTALVNSFATVTDAEELGLTDTLLRQPPITCLRFPEPSTATYPLPPRCPYTSLKQFYCLDLARLLPALLLGVQPHHTVLQMCAAPGGSALALAMQLLRGGAGSSGSPAGQPGEEQQQQQLLAQPAAEREAAAGSGAGLTAGMLQALSLAQQGAAGDGSDVQSAPPQEQHEHVQQHGAAAVQPAAEGGDVATGGAPHTGAVTGKGSAGHDASGGSSGGSGGSTADEQDSQEGDDASPGPPPATTTGATGSGGSSRAVGRLVCNEADPGRRARLAALLADYLPGSLRRHVRVTGHEPAQHWGRFEGGLYDAVLLEAPCSSERHVVQAAMEAGGVVSSSSWSSERCSQLAAQQLRLLLAGLRALKPGGRLVYATRSLDDAQNDGVVAQALVQQQQQQQHGAVRLVPPPAWGPEAARLVQLAGGEDRACGVAVLPDTAGWGPVYVAVLARGTGPA